MNEFEKNSDTRLNDTGLSHNNDSSFGDTVDLQEVWNVLWKNKSIIAVTTLVFSLLSVTYSLSLPNIYISSSLLSPSNSSEGGVPSIGGGQIGGLASLAGINLSSGNSKVSVALEVIMSRKFLKDLIEKHNLKPLLVAVEGWDRQKNKLQYNSDIYDEVNKSWADVESAPSMWSAYLELESRLSVVQDTMTGFVTVSIAHYSPHVAQELVGLIIREINIVMKEKDVVEAEKSIDYLARQINETPLVGMKEVFYQLIEEQSKTIMLAHVRDEYIFSVIDPPVVPETKSKPRRAMVCIFGTLLGFLLALAFVFFRLFLKA